MNAKPIKEILSDYLQKKSLNEINIIIKMERIWEIVGGKTISKNTEVIMLKKGVLTIKTSNPIWRNELSLQKNELIDKINKMEEKVNITEIIFR